MRAAGKSSSVPALESVSCLSSDIIPLSNMKVQKEAVFSLLTIHDVQNTYCVAISQSINQSKHICKAP